MEWNDFLKNLETHLQTLEDRLQLEESRLKKKEDDNEKNEKEHAVIYDSSWQIPTKNHVHVGIGIWLCEGDDGSLNLAGDGIALNNKMGIRFTSIKANRIPSVTDLILSAGEELCTYWREKFNNSFSLESFFSQWTLVVEDTSPDSCVGLICFLARLSGIDPGSIPRDWIQYVRRWEQGDIKTTGEPFSSFGALHNALAHGYFDIPKTNSDGKTAATDGNINLSMGQAWLACLRFDLAALMSGASPSNFTPTRTWPELWQARAFLNYEYQQYRQSLQHATTLQLALPMTGPGKRIKLVDAFLEEERIPLGSKKCFIRNDRKNSWMQDGFTLMGLYRPMERGTGNDMTITVEPTSAVHLKDLWIRLEELEDEKWGDERPSDNPRVGIAMYPKGKRNDGSNAPNEPWYDEQGRYTLIAAPKAVQEGKPGTKLSWPEVVSVLWEMYCPVRNLMVKPICQNQRTEEEQEVCPLNQCPDLNEPCSRSSAEEAPKKRFIVAQWIIEGTESQSVLLSPTVQRYMAAHAAGGHESTGIIPIQELPDTDAFDFVKVPGGFGVIHENGVFFIDDWQTEKLDIPGIKSQIDAIEQRLAKVREIQLDLNDIIKQLKAGKSSGIKLQEKLSRLKLGMQQTLAATGIKNPKAHLKEVRECLEKRWEINQRLETFYDAADQIEQTIRGHSELRTNRFISNLTIYAFPFAFFAAFFGFIIEKIPDTFTVNGKKIFLGWWGINWNGLAIYITISLCVVWLFYYIYEKRQERNDTDQDLMT